MDVEAATYLLPCADVGMYLYVYMDHTYARLKLRQLILHSSNSSQTSFGSMILAVLIVI